MASTSDRPSGAVISRDDETTVYPVVPAPPPPLIRAAPLPPSQTIEPPVVAVPPPIQQIEPPVTPARLPAEGPPLRPRYATVGRVVFAGVVLLLFGAVEAFGGALGAVFAASLRKAFDQALRSIDVRIEPTALPTVVAGTFVALLLVDVLHLAAAAGVLSHRTWGRVLGVLLAIVGVGAGAFLVYQSIDVRVMRLPAVLAALGILVPYAISVLALVMAGDHFRPRRLRR